MSAKASLPCGRALIALVALAVSLLRATPAVAHELMMTTARVSLRDAQIDVRVEVDILGLVARLAAINPPELGAADDAELSALLGRAKNEMETGTLLEADGVRVGLEARAFPSPTDLRALVARHAAAPLEHGELVRVELEGSRAVAGAHRITLSLPPTLGEALTTFVQPTTRWTQPGAVAGFSILEARVEMVPGATRLPVPTPKPWLATAAVGLALAAMFSNLVLHRRKPR